MAVKMVISVWMMIFQISFLLLMIVNFKLRIKNKELCLARQFIAGIRNRPLIWGFNPI